jgi:hypothetical protein
LRDLEKQTVRILATIRSAMNELRPVNRLPPEIFVKVFEVREKEKDLDVATHVCARWRAILTSTPYLWTKIDFEHPTRASLYLERSRSALIDVTVGKTRDTIIGPVGTFIGATPWVVRMKSLSLQTDMEQIKKIAERLCHKTPNLKSLTFEGKARRYSYSSLGGTGNGGAIYVPREFLGRHAPLLESLTFHLVSPSVVFTFPLPKLTRIDWVAEAAHVVIEELLDLFVSSPMLEDIRMHVLIRRTQMHRPLKQVSLNQLRKLDWADCDGSISLIPCLVAPKLSQLALKVTHNPQHQRPTLSTILSPYRDHIPLLLEPTAVEYIYKNGNRSCRFSYHGSAFLSIREVTKGRSADTTASRWFSPDLPVSFSGTQELTVEAAGGCPPLDDVPIEQFGSLQRLQFTGETDSLVPMIKLNRSISGSVLSAPCPELSEIWITPRDHYFALSGLMEVLGQRREADYGVKTIRILGRYKFTQTQILELRKSVDQVIAK